jgi:8-oxo-dGTP diphosphatase
VLLLRRLRAPFAGLWNGLGGKVEPGEKPRASALRELREEASIAAHEIAGITRLGIVSWVYLDNDSAVEATGSMSVFLVELDSSRAPWTGSRSCPEGELAWFPERILSDRDDSTLVPNIPIFFPAMLADERPTEYRCIYREGELEAVERMVPAEAGLDLNSNGQMTWRR